MPNWVTNIVKSDNKDLLRKLEDFNQIIPMPEPLQQFNEGFRIFWSTADFFDFVKSKDAQVDLDTLKELAQEFATLNNKPEALEDEYILQAHTWVLTGYATPPAWARENWGTKWSACTFDMTADGCVFDTAWRHPFPLIDKLSKMHPEEVLEVTFADEDIGYNLGQYTIKNGNVEWLYIEDEHTHKENCWFAFCVKGWEDDFAWSEERQCYTYKESDSDTEEIGD